MILAIGNGSWPQRMGDCKCSTDEILGGDWDCVNQWLMKADQAPSSPYTCTSVAWPVLPIISRSIGDPHFLLVGKSLLLCSFPISVCH